MNPAVIYLSLLFLATSIVYSMTGQGGATAYLAILALFNLPHGILPPIALSCNIVATISVVYIFRRAGHLRLRLAIPFIITSIPASFIGGMLTISGVIFKILLIVVLLATSLMLFFKKIKGEGVQTPSIKKAYLIGPMIGIPLGLAAGLVGIGGGVFLLPIIIVLKWGRTKEAAAASGLFTLVNSTSGLIGHGIRGSVEPALIIPLVVAAIIGSQIGARLGSKKISSRVIEKIFAVLLFAVAVRLTVDLL